jgi:hypothetical protein
VWATIGYIGYLNYRDLVAKGEYCNGLDYDTGGMCFIPTIPFDKFVIGTATVALGFVIMMLSMRTHTLAAP